jgi:nucleoside-diphosphate-sugar epimerase
MRVFIVGATGVYGRALVPLLVDRGDTVVALVRSLVRAESIAGPQVQAFEGDLLHEPRDRLVQLMRGCDAAAHLATALRPGAAGVDGSNTNAALRVDGTRRLLDAVLAAGVPRYIQQSIVMAYSDGGDRWLDERAPLEQPSDAATPSPVVAMEAMVRGLDQSRVGWSILRGGAFVGVETAQDGVIARLRDGTLRVPGDGSNWVSHVHVQDMAAATVAALDRAPPGSIFNINDEPMRNGDYLDRLAALLHLPAPTRDPGLPAPRSFRCSNAAAKQVLGSGIWRDVVTLDA